MPCACVQAARVSKVLTVLVHSELVVKLCATHLWCSENRRRQGTTEGPTRIVIASVYCSYKFHPFFLYTCVYCSHLQECLCRGMGIRKAKAAQLKSCSFLSASYRGFPTLVILTISGFQLPEFSAMAMRVEEFWIVNTPHMEFSMIGNHWIMQSWPHNLNCFDCSCRWVWSFSTCLVILNTFCLKLHSLAYYFHLIFFD